MSTQHQDTTASGAAGGFFRTGGTLDRFFHITERGSTIGCEIRGGFATFFAMSYIVVLNLSLIHI